MADQTCCVEGVCVVVGWIEGKIALFVEEFRPVEVALFGRGLAREMGVLLQEASDLPGAFFRSESADAVDENAARSELFSGLTKKFPLKSGEGFDVFGVATPASFGMSADHAEAGAGSVDEDQVEGGKVVGEVVEGACKGGDPISEGGSGDGFFQEFQFGRLGFRGEKSALRAGEACKVEGFSAEARAGVENAGAAGRGGKMADELAAEILDHQGPFGESLVDFRGGSLGPKSVGGLFKRLESLGEGIRGVLKGAEVKRGTAIEGFGLGKGLIKVGSLDHPAGDPVRKRGGKAEVSDRRFLFVDGAKGVSFLRFAEHGPENPVGEAGGASSPAAFDHVDGFVDGGVLGDSVEIDELIDGQAQGEENGEIDFVEPTADELIDDRIDGALVGEGAVDEFRGESAVSFFEVGFIEGGGESDMAVSAVFFDPFENLGSNDAGSGQLGL